jgi:hypothetical protein
MNITPMKQIRRKCMDCSGNSSKEVEHCPLVDCDLYLYRHGRRFTDKEYKEHQQQLKEMKGKQ